MARYISDRDVLLHSILFLLDSSPLEPEQVVLVQTLYSQDILDIFNRKSSDLCKIGTLRSEKAVK
jgi:hypothetical protein